MANEFDGERLDVIVVGAGQAGLALGYHLRRVGLRFVLLEAGPEVGHSWRSRWDSLRLFTPAQYANLPGWQFPAPADIYPGKDQVADYLRDYAQRFALPIQLGIEVTGLDADEPHGFVTRSEQVQFRARQVVLATGPFSIPRIPAIAATLDARVTQLHTTAYRSPSQIPQGQVLVVGGGNSGFQIAGELAAAGRDVALAIGRSNACVPQRILGRDLFWWQDKVGLLQVTAESRLGKLMAANDGTVIGSSRRGLRDHGVVLRPRVTGVTGRMVTFADGSAIDVDVVVWATGFRLDDRWVTIENVLDEDGRLRHQRGVTKMPGLYVVGRPWQHTAGSALLGFVQHDAEWLADRVAGAAT